MLRILSALLIAVFLLPVRPALAQTCGETYTVVEGETLYSIAEKCNVSYLVLMGINYEMSDPARIYPGQVIRLAAEAPLEFYQQPITGPAQAGGLQGSTYVVRSGDSLARIAYLYNTTVYDIQLANPQLGDSTVIFTGQTLQMPATARLQKGWVGVDVLTADRSDPIQARVVDFPPYAKIEFRLGLSTDPDYSFQTIVRTTDARGRARAKLTLPFYVEEDEIYVVRVFDLDDPESGPVVSPGVLIVD